MVRSAQCVRTNAGTRCDAKGDLRGRCYNMIGGISRLAKTAVRFAPQADSGLGIEAAWDQQAANGQHVWIRKLYQTNRYFDGGQKKHRNEVRYRLGGCPALVVPKQRRV